MGESARERMGLGGPPKELQDLTPLDPDRRPSEHIRAFEIEDQGMRYVLEVKGLGAIVLRATFDQTTGKALFNGCSTFRDVEIY